MSYPIGTDLKCTPGTVSGGVPPLVKTYQWELDGVEILGATSITYTTESEGELTCVETVTDGDSVVISAETLAVTIVPDTILPELSTATIATNGTTLTLAFSEAVSQGAGYGDADWSISAAITTGLSIAYVSGDGTNEWTMAITGGPVLESATDDPVTIDWAGTVDGIEDGAGNDMDAITAGAVDNNSTQSAAANPLADIKTGMLGWWDLESDGSDAFDSNNDNRYNLVSQGSPTFGNPATFNTTNHVYSSDSLETAMSAATDLTVLVMVKSHASQQTGECFQKGQNAYSELTYRADAVGLNAKIFNVGVSLNGGALAVDTDYLVGVQSHYDGVSDITVREIQNGVRQGTATAAKGSMDSLYRFGYSNTTGSYYYWIGMWTRLLTDDELAALNDETLNYAALP